MSGINWQIELPKLARQFDGSGRPSTSESHRPGRAADRFAQQRQRVRAALLAIWARLVLVLGLVAAVLVWPYGHECGLGLLGYMSAELLIFAGAAWVAILTWEWRLPRTHCIALTIGALALAFIAADVLPRIGYAYVASSHPPEWRCGEPTHSSSTRSS